MDSSEKLKQLEEEFRNVSNQKETLEKQIAFHIDWVIPKLAPGAELKSEKKFLASLKADYSEIARKKEILEKRLRAEQSKEFDFGWKKKETDDLMGRSTGGLSAHSSEMKALQIIAEEGGSTNFGVVSRKMRIEYDYARLLCLSLGRADYIDIITNGKCKMAPKGEKELEKKGLVPWL